MPDKLNTVRAPDVTSNPGLAVDAGGNPVIDPTKNVLDLVRAAVERLNDLREAQEKYLLAEMRGLRENVDTKFAGIENQLQANENRRIESKEDNQKSLDAALSAAKEAVKEQAATSKEATAQQNQTFTAQLGGVEKGVSDLRDRLATLETRREARDESRSDNRASIVTIVSIIGAIVVVVNLIIVVFVKATA